jgi:hypothetical protein
MQTRAQENFLEEMEDEIFKEISIYYSTFTRREHATWDKEISEIIRGALSYTTLMLLG